MEGVACRDRAGRGAKWERQGLRGQDVRRAGEERALRGVATGVGRGVAPGAWRVRREDGATSAAEGGARSGGGAAEAVSAGSLYRAAPPGSARGPDAVSPIPGGKPGGHSLLCASDVPARPLPRSPTPREGRPAARASLWEGPCLDPENGYRHSVSPRKQNYIPHKWKP